MVPLENQQDALKPGVKTKMIGRAERERKPNSFDEFQLCDLALKFGLVFWFPGLAAIRLQSAQGCFAIEGFFPIATGKGVGTGRYGRQQSRPRRRIAAPPNGVPVAPSRAEDQQQMGQKTREHGALFILSRSEAALSSVGVNAYAATLDLAGLSGPRRFSRLGQFLSSSLAPWSCGPLWVIFFSRPAWRQIVRGFLL